MKNKAYKIDMKSLGYLKNSRKLLRQSMDSNMKEAERVMQEMVEQSEWHRHFSGVQTLQNDEKTFHRL